ncbi:MAG: hypothetical protein ACRYF8_16690 [Janthinobacterium lividum]
MLSTDLSFRKIAAMTDAVYKISDWADLCCSPAAQQDVADALERIVQTFLQEVTELQAEYGDGQ